MQTIDELARELDVTADDVQAYVAQLVTQDGEPAVIAQPSSEPGKTTLTDRAVDRVRVQLTH
ncbi:hypothetical protein [Catellatospora vulcania]|uniref:hypothetical protein n=1 Tax=Catellatospora vulcania TaxID=1460450 RepID=UPI0012D3C455|nr:hypothetical protein [Catellatospora vulcania]